MDTADELKSKRGWGGEVSVSWEENRGKEQVRVKQKTKGWKSGGREGGGYIIRQDVCSATCCKVKGDNGR